MHIEKDSDKRQISDSSKNNSSDNSAKADTTQDCMWYTQNMEGRKI
jgi:hypothetical protein